MVTEELSPSDEENSSNNVEKYNLNGISFKNFLVHFYSKYNPEKISMIDFIAETYESGEHILISDLAEKYQLSQAEMQRQIDASRRMAVSGKITSKSRGPPSDTSADSEPESEPVSEPVSDISSSSLRPSFRQNGSPYSQRGVRKGVSFSEANSVRTFDRHSSPARSDSGDMNTMTKSQSPASLQDIINRNKNKDRTQKVPTGDSPSKTLLSPPQNGIRSQSPSFKIQNGKDEAQITRANPAPMRSSSPLQNVVYNQSSGEEYHLKKQREMREKMVQNQQEDVLHQRRQQYQREQEQKALLQQQQQERDRIQQKQQQLQQVVMDDTQYVANQVQAQEELSQRNQPDGNHYSENGNSENNPGPGRSEAVHIEEIKLELERTRKALSVADEEKERVLQLLEEMAAAPMEMRGVVEQFLSSYDRGRSRSNSVQIREEESEQSRPVYESQYQYQLQRAHQNKQNTSDRDSVGSSTSSAYRMRELEGQDSRRRTLSPSIRDGSPVSKSYMLGTASSTKRETENARNGGKTGAYNVSGVRHASPLGDRSSSSQRSSSAGGQQFGRRFIRPSPSPSRGRSASPAGSGGFGSRRSGRSSSPASSITSADVERQYFSTRQRIDQSTQQSKSSQMHGLKKIDHASRESSLERQKALSKGPVLDSPRQKNLESATDWVVCVDPKSQRKYYYSRTLNKSTWTAPANLSSNNVVNAPTRNSSNGRARPTARAEMSSGNSYRSSSPAGSTTSSRGSVLWKPAKDPKTGRTYWFNRKTRETTWKNPYE